MVGADFRILIVDDQESMRETLGDVLADCGYHVTLAQDGYEAISKARMNHFTVIFMDIVMPGINGLEAFREIKKIDPGSAVIFMTAYSKERIIREAMAEGAYKEITKPFEIDDIINIVKEIKDKLDRKESERR